MTTDELDERQDVDEDQDDTERAARCRRARRAALVCHRCTALGPITVEATYWDTAGQARQAEAELTPCGPLCVDVHTVVDLPDPRRRAGRHRPSTVRTGNTRADEVSP
jgi:hypothetical protein